MRWIPPQIIEEDLPGERLRLSWLRRPETPWWCWLLGRLRGCFVSLEATQGALSLTRASPQSSPRIHKDSLKKALLTIGPEGAGRIPMRLTLWHTKSPRAVKIPLDVDGLNTRTEALDLAVRLSRAWGLRGYRVTKSTPEQIEIELLSTLPKEEEQEPYREQLKEGLYAIVSKEVRPLPEPTGAADYHADEPPKEAKKEPAKQAKPFDWSAIWGSALWDRTLFALRAILYIALWALAGIPGGITALLVVMCVLVFIDLGSLLVGGPLFFSDFLALYIVHGLIISGVIGFLYSSYVAIRMARDDH